MKQNKIQLMRVYKYHLSNYQQVSESKKMSNCFWLWSMENQSHSKTAT